MRLSSACALALLSSIASSGAVASPPRARGACSRPPCRALRPEDLFRLRRVERPEISPDGRRVAYVLLTPDERRDESVPELRIVDRRTGSDVAVAAVGGGAAWSPGSDRLAYADADGGGPSIRIVPVFGGRIGAPSATVRVPAPASEVAWSPDGRSLAFVAFVAEPVPRDPPALVPPRGASWPPEPSVTTAFRYLRDGGGGPVAGTTRLFVADVATGAVRALGGPVGDAGPPSWSPDGRSLLASFSPRAAWDANPADADVWRVPFDGSAAVRLDRRVGPDRDPAASPDGGALAWTGFDYSTRDYSETRLYVAARDGSNPRDALPALDREVYEFHWSGRDLLVSYGDRGLVRLGRVTPDGALHPVADDLLDGSFSTSSAGVVAYVAGSTASPGRLVVRALGVAETVSDPNADALASVVTARVAPLEVRSTADGLPVQGWVFLPPGAAPGTRLPTILSIHGGPFGFDGPWWTTETQLYVAAGYAVVAVNYRGSTSYGAAFADWANRAFPGRDYDDLMTAVDAVVARGVADPRRLFVTGGSAGGEETAWIVGRTRRFAAAVAVKPVIDRLSNALDDDQYVYANLFRDHRPWEDVAGMWRTSPLSLVGSVSTPTMLMVGAEDARTPPTQSRMFYSALQLRGVPSALAVVPGVGHESLMSRPSNYAWVVAATLGWFMCHDAATVPGDGIVDGVRRAIPIGCPATTPAAGER